MCAVRSTSSSIAFNRKRLLALAQLVVDASAVESHRQPCDSVRLRHVGVMPEDLVRLRYAR